MGAMKGCYLIWVLKDKRFPEGAYGGGGWKILGREMIVQKCGGSLEHLNLKRSG